MGQQLPRPAPGLGRRETIAEGLGPEVGDSLVVNVLGRNVTARVANLRVVDWENLGINFVLVFSPGSFGGAPHAVIATLTYPRGGGPQAEADLVKADKLKPSRALPRSGSRRCSKRSANLLAKFILAIRGASILTLTFGGAGARAARWRPAHRPPGL